jgi:hypothetical protein
MEVPLQQIVHADRDGERSLCYDAKRRKHHLTHQTVRAGLKAVMDTAVSEVDPLL